MTKQSQVGKRLREAREAAGLTQQQAADWLGIRRPAIAEIESGKRAVKSDELARLSSLYGRSLSWLAVGETGPEELVTAALFRAGDSVDPTLRREASLMARRCHLLAKVEHSLGQTRTTTQTRRYVDETALLDQTRAYEHGRAVAYQERDRLGLGMTAPLRDPWGIVEGAGLHVLLLHLGSNHHVDGIFTRLANDKACVGVNVDKWVFRQVFTVVHEYAHAILDSGLQSELCDTSQGWRPAEQHLYANRELRANQFAAVFLVPQEALVSYVESRGMIRYTRERGRHVTGLSPVELVRAQDYFGVSSEMLLWRLQNENLLNATERRTVHQELLRHGVMNIARGLGYQWRSRAQPFTRAHELALAGYTKGHVALGDLADIFGLDKAEMHERLRELEVYQEFDETDALIGQPA